MKTLHRTDVIQGDEQCRDGHYRCKLDLREQNATGDAAERRAELDPNDATSLQAQNPFTVGNVRVGRASEEAAGIPAIWNTMLYGIGEMGPIRSSEAFVKINQVTGFDCQSCAWPSPDKKRKIFEFCENGAKAVSDESTKKRITPEFFGQHSIEDLAAQSDYWLNQQGRLTTPMVRHANATHYQPIAWADAFTLIADELFISTRPIRRVSTPQVRPPMSRHFCCSCSPASWARTTFPVVPTCVMNLRGLRWWRHWVWAREPQRLKTWKAPNSF